MCLTCRTCCRYIVAIRRRCTTCRVTSCRFVCSLWTCCASIVVHVISCTTCCACHCLITSFVRCCSTGCAIRLTIRRYILCICSTSTFTICTCACRFSRTCTWILCAATGHCLVAYCYATSIARHTACPSSRTCCTTCSIHIETCFRCNCTWCLCTCFIRTCTFCITIACSVRRYVSLVCSTSTCTCVPCGYTLTVAWCTAFVLCAATCRRLVTICYVVSVTIRTISVSCWTLCLRRCSCC